MMYRALNLGRVQKVWVLVPTMCLGANYLITSSTAVIVTCYCHNWDHPLEKGMASHSSILAWRIPWTEEPGGLRSMESQRVIHNFHNTFTFYHHNITLHFLPPQHGFGCKGPKNTIESTVALTQL